MSHGKVIAVAAVGLAALVSLAGESRAATFDVFQGNFANETKIFLVDTPRGGDFTTLGDVGQKWAKPAGPSVYIFLREQRKIDASNGGTTIKPANSAFDLSVTAPLGYNFTDLLFTFNGSEKNDPGNVGLNDLTVTAFNGIQQIGVPKVLTGLTTGNLAFLVLAGPDTTFTSILLSSDTLDQFKQFQVSGSSSCPTAPGNLPLCRRTWPRATGWLARGKRQPAPVA